MKRRDEDEGFNELEGKEDQIRKLLVKGNNYYRDGNYEDALISYKAAKKLDTENDFVHKYSFYTGSAYNKLAEGAEDTIQKQEYYKKVVKHFKLLAKNYHNHTDGEFGDINALIATALDNAGDKQQATQYFEKTELFKRFGKPTQELGVNSNVSATDSQERSISIKKAYHSFQNRGGKPLSPEETTEILYHISLTQCCQEQRINNLEQENQIVKEKLRIAGIDTKVNIINKINHFKATNPELYKYYVYFNEGLQNIYLASKALASGLLVPNVPHMERIDFDSFWKVWCYGNEIAACLFGRWVNAALNVAHDATDNIFNTSAEKRLKKILENYYNAITKNHDLSLTIEETIQQLALFYTDVKTEEILSIKAENKQGGIIGFITKKLFSAQQKFFDYIDNTDDPVINLVFKDINALVIYVQGNAKEMIESPLPFVAQIAKVTEKELDTYYYKVAVNKGNSIEYALEQIENNTPESAKINQKIEEGHWEKSSLSLLSINWWSLLSFDFFNFIRFSWTGEQRGIKDFCNREYFRANCKKDMTDKDLDNCMLLLFHKICKSGNEQCITLFKETNSDVIDYARVNAPQLFVTAKAVDICISDPAQNEETKEILSSQNSKQRFADCFKKMFPDFDIKKLNEPKVLSLDLPSPRSDDEGDNVPAGGDAIEYNGNQ